jgi:hypothetical protein
MVEPSSMTVKRKIVRSTEPKKDEEVPTYSSGSSVYSSSNYINPNRIEIAFVIDATGSMKSYIDGVRSCLKELVVDLKKELSSFTLAFGICFYRDKKDEGIIVDVETIF